MPHSPVILNDKPLTLNDIWAAVDAAQKEREERDKERIRHCLQCKREFTRKKMRRSLLFCSEKCRKVNWVLNQEAELEKEQKRTEALQKHLLLLEHENERLRRELASR